MTEHNHLIHLLPLLTIFVGALFVYRRHIPRMTTLSLIALVVLSAFTITHVNPAKLLLAHHHEQITHENHHPCCMPSSADGLMIFLILAALFLITVSSDRGRSHITKLSLLTISSRSPPPRW